MLRLCSQAHQGAKILFLDLTKAKTKFYFNFSFTLILYLHYFLHILILFKTIHFKIPQKRTVPQIQCHCGDILCFIMSFIAAFLPLTICC